MTAPDEGIRFAFGRNWASFAEGVDDDQITEATRRLESLVAPISLAGKTFLDIGCGSGLHSLAALNLGASELTAFDLDEDSVSTTSASGETNHWQAIYRRGKNSSGNPRQGAISH